mgnify:CR=1 FL=1
MQSKKNLNYSGIEELVNLELMKNYNNSIVKKSLKYCLKSNSIVDFGAGIGTLSLIFKKRFNKNPICIEIDKSNINYLNKRKLFTLNNIELLEYPVDFIFSSNVLEHIKNDLNILKKMRDKLKNKGTLFLYLPANMILWTKLDSYVGHYRRYKISDLKNLCEKAGFEIIKIHYADFLGFFVTLFWKIFFSASTKSLPSKSSLMFYDNYIFPFSNLLDKIGLRYLIGKNLVLVAKKKENFCN